MLIFKSCKAASGSAQPLAARINDHAKVLADVKVVDSSSGINHAMVVEQFIHDK
jgi:hypothetical protein